MLNHLKNCLCRALRRVEGAFNMDNLIQLMSPVFALCASSFSFGTGSRNKDILAI
jgi:hypothetical protein